MTPSFFDFLESKPLYYKEIDHERVHRAYARLREEIGHPPAVHIVGTNGKGSTGRMLAFLAWQGKPAMENGEWRMENRLSQRESMDDLYPLPTTHYPLSVGHYSSPHILHFNERIWIDGENVSDEVLEKGHRRLYGILGSETSEALSYFEYTTLLALLLFERCDLIVLEAGLGGEFDATNVVENKRLTVVTPIGIDHQAFLGDSAKAIAETKLRSITPYTQVLLAPQPYPEAESVARRIAEECGCGLTMEDGKWKMEELERALQNKAWPEFLLQNASVALRALELLGITTDVEALKDLELFGRFYPLAENIRIDVGHNPLAARAIVEAMEPGTVLIYNSLDDKDYREVLSILRPKLKRVELIPIESQRAATLREIETVLEELGIPWDCFNGQLFTHEHYLVFGSFYTVEAFLKSQNRDRSF